MSLDKLEARDRAAVRRLGADDRIHVVLSAPPIDRFEAVALAENIAQALAAGGHFGVSISVPARHDNLEIPGAPDRSARP